MLARLGRRGAAAVVLFVVIGIATPQIGRYLERWLTPAVLLLLVLAFLRADYGALRAYVRRPLLVILAAAWTSLAIPVLTAMIAGRLGLARRSPELFNGVMLQAIAPPMMATPALVALMGLDATLVLVVLLISTAIVPITAPLFVQWILGSNYSIPPGVLALRLGMLIGTGWLVGVSLRRIIGAGRVERHADSINGISILVLFIFITVLMKGVASGFEASAATIARIVVLTLSIFAATLLVTLLLFAFSGGDRSLALAVMASQRNLGLMLASNPGGLPELTLLYFALAQIPVYLSPLALNALTTPTTQRMYSGASSMWGDISGPPAE